MNCYWIWNYGDFEIYHSNKANSRREANGANYPSRWQLGVIAQGVKFYREIISPAPFVIKVFVCGKGMIKIDGEPHRVGEEITIPAGKHFLGIEVVNMQGLPAAYVQSEVCPSGEGWYTKNAKAEPVRVGFLPHYDAPEKTPESFFFSYERMMPVSRELTAEGTLFDFGKELFGHIQVSNVQPEDKLHISYGESREEALDSLNAILFEDVQGSSSYRLTQRAFRYIYVQGSSSVCVEADYEYLPLPYRGSFRCNDEAINRVWDMCAYTLHLNTREVLLDGVKRDRWCWSGDAYQAYKFSNYLFFDREIVRRTILGLRGGDYAAEHINTITDYSLYWIISLVDYYKSFKDEEFIRFIYPRAVSLMEFVKTREDENGLVVKKYADWVFIDWSEIDFDGPSCAEQMLYIEANRAMATLAELLGIPGKQYAQKALELIQKVNDFYWDGEKGAFIDSFTSGKRNVTRHANIFAVMYDIADEAQKQSILENVLLNDSITKITTPYFAGYELDALGKLGSFDAFENMLRSYWKGMLDLGATTVWEEFDPKLTGAQHYEMYGMKYGKSLCHAWGAGPIYLFGRYYLGVYPTKAGFEEFEVKPYLGNFCFIEGTVPVLDGEVHIALSETALEVTATRDGGTLIWNGERHMLEKNQTRRIHFSQRR